MVEAQRLTGQPGQGGGGGRRRRPDRRRGLRGAEPGRLPAAQPPGGAERQRDVHLAQRGRALGVVLEEVRLAHLQPLAPLGEGLPAPACPRASRPSSSSGTASTPPRPWSPRASSSRAWASTTSGRSTATTSRSWCESFRSWPLFDGPVLVHAITTKGKGYQPAESDKATRGHGLSFFDVATGKPVKKATAKSYTDLFAEALCERDGARPAGRRHHRGHAGGHRAHPVPSSASRTAPTTWASPSSTRSPSRPAWPARACVRWWPSTPPSCSAPTTRSSTTWRCSRCPVTFALDRGGLVGADGKTHQGAFDLAYLRCIPNLTVHGAVRRERAAPPCSTPRCSSPARPRSASRAARARASRWSRSGPLEVGRGRLVRDVPGKPDVLRGGGWAPRCTARWPPPSGWRTSGVGVTVVDPRFVKPLDDELDLRRGGPGAGAWSPSRRACLAGGFGSAPASSSSTGRGLLAGVAVKRLGLPDRFVPTATPPGSAPSWARRGRRGRGLPGACWARGRPRGAA